MSANPMNWRVSLYAIALGILWGVFALYALMSAQGVGTTALTLPFENEIKPIYRTVFPQGWRFFTKSPTEDEFMIFQQTGTGSWYKAFDGPMAEFSNLVGLKRVARAQGLEFGLLSQSVPQTAWSECEAETNACLDSYEILDVKNPSSYPLYCGITAFVTQRPLPWAWANFQKQKPFSIPSKLVVVNSLCH